jgi:hypothetical protein
VGGFQKSLELGLFVGRSWFACWHRQLLSHKT